MIKVNVETRFYLLSRNKEESLLSEEKLLEYLTDDEKNKFEFDHKRKIGLHYEPRYDVIKYIFKKRK